MLDSILDKFSKIISFYKSKRHLQNYIKSNRNMFKRKIVNDVLSPTILVELNAQCSSHIAYSYMCNALSKKYNAQIKGYYPYRHKDMKAKFKHRIKVVLNVFPFNVYNSFNCNSFFDVTISKAQALRAAALTDVVLKKIKTKSELEELRIWDIWIGDLIYDSYLMEFKEPTINLDSTKFTDYFSRKIEEFVFWYDYISSHDIRSIIISHCVYVTAFPLRIAANKSLEVYQINAHNFYRLDKNNLFGDHEFVKFPDEFKALPLNVRENGLALAEERISRRFSGEVGVDMVYSRKSSFGSSLGRRLIRESDKYKILIATHCFFDSPHIYGNNIFPDFYEWLEFIGDISNQTDYDWYIKTHPDYRHGNKEIIDSFVSRYPRITLLPPNSSHHQIIAEGINFALTVYGTIGFEYAALGIPVINCSQVNPHIAYNFNIHARSAAHYKELLINLPEINLNINRKDVLEYYFMRNIYHSNNILFNNYPKVLEEIGGYYNQFNRDIYAKWLDELSDRKHAEINTIVREFLDSKEYKPYLRN